MTSEHRAWGSPCIHLLGEHPRQGTHLAAMLALHQVGELHEGEGVLLGGGCLGSGRQGDCVGEGASGTPQAVPHNVKAAEDTHTF